MPGEEKGSVVAKVSKCTSGQKERQGVESELSRM